MCIFLVAIFQQWIRIRRMESLEDAEWQQAVCSAATRLKLTRPITTLVADDQRVPAVFGLIRSTLVVPGEWQTWSDEQRDCILLHELAHVQRRDVATQVFARFAVLLQWFNPLAWYAARQLRVERELASDDCVLRTGCPASKYAEQLLLTVQRHQPARIALGVAMAHSDRLEDRVRAILNPRLNRKTVGRRSFAVTSVLTLMCCVAIGAMTPTNGPVPITGLQSDPQAPVWKAGHTLSLIHI